MTKEVLIVSYGLAKDTSFDSEWFSLLFEFFNHIESYYAAQQELKSTWSQYSESRRKAILADDISMLTNYRRGGLSIAPENVPKILNFLQDFNEYAAALFQRRAAAR